MQKPVTFCGKEPKLNLMVVGMVLKVHFDYIFPILEKKEHII